MKGRPPADGEYRVSTSVEEDRYRKVASGLAAAYLSRQPVEPPRDQIPGLDLQGAYRIQQLQQAAFESAGRRVVGRKIGLTSLAMQRQLGVDSPDFGFVTDDLVFEHDTEIELDRFISPKVEPELGFVLARDVSPGESIQEIAGAVGSVRTAVEIIDSRVRDWDIRLVDTVADNASCGAIILGEPLEVNPADLPRVSAVMSIDGIEVGRGTGADVMGHPLEPLRWLAGVLSRHGVTLRKGEVVLTGSFCGAVTVEKGQTVTVDYGSYGKIRNKYV